MSATPKEAGPFHSPRREVDYVDGIIEALRRADGVGVIQGDVGKFSDQLNVHEGTVSGEQFGAIVSQLLKVDR